MGMSGGQLFSELLAVRVGVLGALLWVQNECKGKILLQT